MSNLGHELSGGTIANILKRHGVEPATERKRKTMWKEFLSRHFDQIGATDFFTVEVWTKNGPQRFIANVGSAARSITTTATSHRRPRETRTSAVQNGWHRRV